MTLAQAVFTVHCCDELAQFAIVFVPSSDSGGLLRVAAVVYCNIWLCVAAVVYCNVWLCVAAVVYCNVWLQAYPPLPSPICSLNATRGR